MRLTTNVARLGIAYFMAASVCILPSWSLTNQDVVYAVKKAEILGPGVGINARVDKDKVSVATYRNAKNNEKDTKIDAAIIAKTVAELAGDDIVRVTVYFYGNDMSSYDEVSLTKGDIKAFSSGQVGKDEFLSSLVVNKGKQDTGADRVARRLEGNAVARTQYKVALNNADAVDISADLESWVSDEDAKLEALQVAMKAASAVPPEATKIKVSFADPSGKGELREVVFNKSDLSGIWKGVQASLESATLAKKVVPVDAGNLTVKLGPHREEREKLLVQLKELDKLGVGIEPFVRAFQAIEANLTMEDAKLVEAINRLSTSLADQEKAFKAAKAAKPTKTAAAAPGKPVKTGTGRWAGSVNVIPEEALANPDGMAARALAETGGGPNYKQALEKIANHLRGAGRAAEAAKFDSMAASVR